MIMDDLFSIPTLDFYGLDKYLHDLVCSYSSGSIGEIDFRLALFHFNGYLSCLIRLHSLSDWQGHFLCDAWLRACRIRRSDHSPSDGFDK